MRGGEDEKRGEGEVDRGEECQFFFSVSRVCKGVCCEKRRTFVKLGLKHGIFVGISEERGLLDLKEKREGKVAREEGRSEGEGLEWEQMRGEGWRRSEGREGGLGWEERSRKEKDGKKARRRGLSGVARRIRGEREEEKMRRRNVQNRWLTQG